MGLFLAVQFMFLLAMTQSESLHKSFHHDAGKPNHHCLVTILQSGQVDAAGCAVDLITTLALPAASIVVTPLAVSWVDYSLPPTRGPPPILS